MNSGPVLVAIVLGAHADEAIKAADSWARRGKTPLVVCHVAPDLLRRHALLPELALSDASVLPRLDEQLRRAVRER